MKKFENIWDENNSKYIVKMGEGWKPPQNDWIEKYLDRLPKGIIDVLELGCGVGATTQYLIGAGFDVLATDISKVALEYVEKTVPMVVTMQVDLNGALPFENESYSIIVADLSLHYFTTEKTIEIMKEIGRVLKAGGVLVTRVNSVNEATYGQGEEVEENLYFANGYYRRYFDIETAKKFFGIIGDVFAVESEAMRQISKKMIDVIVTK